MTESELREKCGLAPGALISTNLGFLDILGVCDGMVSLGVIATGQIIHEPCSSVIEKLKSIKKEDD